MQKPPESTDRNAGCDRGFKPWPLKKHDAHEQDRPVRTDSLHARFNPRLVGFGIVGPTIDASESIGDRSQTLQATDGPCAQDPEERK